MIAALRDQVLPRPAAADHIDYLHVGKVDDKWVIINVLWTVKAKE
jgi:hypothetical protein